MLVVITICSVIRTVTNYVTCNIRKGFNLMHPICLIWCVLFARKSVLSDFFSQNSLAMFKHNVVCFPVAVHQIKHLVDVFPFPKVLATRDILFFFTLQFVYLKVCHPILLWINGNLHVCQFHVFPSFLLPNTPDTHTLHHHKLTFISVSYQTPPLSFFCQEPPSCSTQLP